MKTMARMIIMMVFVINLDVLADYNPIGSPRLSNHFNYAMTDDALFIMIFTYIQFSTHFWC